MNIVAGLGTAAVSGQLQAAYKTNKSIGRAIAHKLRARPLLDLAGTLEVESSSWMLGCIERIESRGKISLNVGQIEGRRLVQLSSSRKSINYPGLSGDDLWHSHGSPRFARFLSPLVPRES